MSTSWSVIQGPSIDILKTAYNAYLEIDIDKFLAVFKPKLSESYRYRSRVQRLLSESRRFKGREKDLNQRPRCVSSTE